MPNLVLFVLFPGLFGRIAAKSFKLVIQSGEYISDVLLSVEIISQLGKEAWLPIRSAVQTHDKERFNTARTTKDL
jgi:hypothetical protein